MATTAPVHRNSHHFEEDIIVSQQHSLDMDAPLPPVDPAAMPRRASWVADAAAPPGASPRRRESRASQTFQNRPVDLAFAASTDEKKAIVDFLSSYTAEGRQPGDPEVPVTLAGRAPRTGVDDNLPKEFRVLGIRNRQELARMKALQVMGISEEDLSAGQYYFNPSRSPDNSERLQEVYGESGSQALMKFFGCDEEALLRKKAMEVLGLTEEDMAQERANRLSQVGDESSTS